MESGKFIVRGGDSLPWRAASLLVERRRLVTMERGET